MIQNLTDEERLRLSRSFGERTGLDVLPEEIEVIYPWLFYKTDYDDGIEDDGIEVYRLPLPIEAEPWTNVSFDQSPFGTKDPTILTPMIDKLNAGYDED